MDKRQRRPKRCMCLQPRKCRYTMSKSEADYLLVSATDKLHAKISEMVTEVAVKDTMMKLEQIRRSEVIADILKVSDLNALHTLQEKYRKFTIIGNS